MTPVRIRAEDVAQLLSALDRAAVATQDNYALWSDIISARAFVCVYIVERFQPLDVTVPGDTNV